MTTWTPEDLDRVATADELDIATSRADGSLRDYVTIWAVRVDAGLYVRSYKGNDGAWYRHALERPEGRIRGTGVELDVAFEQPDDVEIAAVDDAYRRKYARYGDNYLAPMTAASARAATLRLASR